ncbi:enolase-phosphatase E1 [Hirsutella rhossiliensis]|uniref:Enolase-phosphatase E1 n=1 Tax=Hirsutella rhossiliensis TaxID=111463 RepID=A0A9P8MTS2_9HYPO|nr:enolase-phosphatase E1 [Hirsutella rhossiliensis]KAH0960056.1 enolase-phosphatase E1 [Hirsutella rhossiliensis]
MAMNSLAGFDVLVLDIEGTVCPISFVHDVLFPYALDTLTRRLDGYWDSSDFAPYRNAFPEPYRGDRGAFEAHVRQLVAQDIKAPYLKALQGHLWHQGYESGDLEAPVFPDVGPFITTAHASGKKIIIYSSGSVPAQKLFFSHTTAQPSDLTPFISAWFDTVNAGPKTEATSYTTILSSSPDITPARWLFLSDNLKEVGAALASGMRSLPVTRPGNAPLPPDDPLSQLAIRDFAPESAESITACLAGLAAMPRPIRS